MNQSSCIASHTRQKQKRGEVVFNAKISRITDGKWKKGLSVTVTWTRHYYSTTRTSNMVTCHIQHAFILILLWKHGSIMFHEISQSSYRPGFNLASHIWGSSLVIAIKCDTSESGFEMLRLPEQGLITTQNISPFRILHYTCTSLNYWCGTFAYDVHCSEYHMRTSFIRESTYWFLKAFTQSFNRMWISLCLRSALVYWYGRVSLATENLVFGEDLV